MIREKTFIWTKHALLRLRERLDQRKYFDDFDIKVEYNRLLKKCDYIIPSFHPKFGECLEYHLTVHSKNYIFIIKVENCKYKIITVIIKEYD